MYLHKEGKIAEYKAVGDGYFDLIGRPDGQIWFDNQLYHPASKPSNGYASKTEAYLDAMGYHETEGCALYLELHPAPEKGEYAFIAQDADGEWCGYDHKPDLKEDAWVERTSLDWHHICKSPPNPFWRKTLR